MTTTATNQYSGLGFSTTNTTTTTTPTAGNGTSSGKQALGQDDFLKLLTTQMTHQDPTKPMENGDFMAQMAQFGTVSGIQDLQKSFSSFSNSMSSNQALQAASLVGQYVSTPSSVGQLNTDPGYVSGTFDLPSTSISIDVKIIDPSSGKAIRTIPIGEHAAGSVPFVWDGKDDAGNTMAQGLYKIQPEALLGGVKTVLQPNVDTKVDSVLMGGTNGVQLNLDGIGAVDMSKIKEVL